MTPFKTSSIFADLHGQYPEASKIQKVATSGGSVARNTIARLWLSEGIPYAFKEFPALYEEIRTWLAVRLDVDPKEISITGSARIGQSLAPYKIGKAFSSQSDLDLFVVSETLLNKLRLDFNSWSFNVESGHTKPNNEREAGFWKENLTRGNSYFSKGFFDAKLIPTHSEYTCASNIANTMWLLKEKLCVTPNAPQISSASIRCYRSWADFTQQVSINLAQK